MVIDVLPLDEQKQDYDRASLSLLDPDAISLDLNGALTRRDLDSMAVASLDVVESSPGRITGKLGLIVRDGYWEIGFTNAVWRVVDYHYMPKTERM